MYYTTNVTSPVGKIMLASDSLNLTGLWIEGQKYHGRELGIALTEKDNLSVFKQTQNWLDLYFAGKAPKIADLPLAPAGSEFRRSVWKILCDIPYGEVLTYGEIAGKIAHQMGKASMSAQAVGGAIAHNPISIIIPCHRVAGSNGSLTGYAGGIENKIMLLELEGVSMTRFYVP